MFIDELILTVQSGMGGNGCSAFRREKYVPLGGPAGGDGGDGGDVILLADPQLTTFGDMTSDRVIRAQPGGHGMGGNCHGGDGETRVVGVPPGTTVRDAETGEVLVDLASPGDRWLAAKGGRGGYGNSHYATATDQAPTRTTYGAPGVRRKLRLELRLLADAGLVGLPNAGKSTLLSRLSRATPRIADYPFTTLEPYLGLVEVGAFKRFVLADLPGLIAGAHEGKGLGDRFLRHVERTRVLVHLVDLFPLDGSDPAHAYRTVRAEIVAYGHGLAERPEIVAGTKCDANPAGAAAAAQALASAIGRRVVPISAVAGSGLTALVAAIADELGAPRPEGAATLAVTGTVGPSAPARPGKPAGAAPASEAVLPSQAPSPRPPPSRKARAAHPSAADRSDAAAPKAPAAPRAPAKGRVPAAKAPRTEVARARATDGAGKAASRKPTPKGNARGKALGKPAAPSPRPVKGARTPAVAPGGAKRTGKASGAKGKSTAARSSAAGSSAARGRRPR